MGDRELKFFQAVNEALYVCLDQDPAVYIMGLGVPDPKGVFGTTLGLQEKYGPNRVMDMPVSENGMTGVAIGSALVGMRPVMTHQRVDFALLALEQIVNQAANWHYMFGGKTSIPLVIRLIIGRGWGQGPQHSQSLQAWFAHVPGLKVVMPTTPHDAKGLLIASIEDRNPVIFLEHRWLHNISGYVPPGVYRVPLGQGKIVRSGRDLTIAATSYMVLESLRAAEMLAAAGVSAEVLDVRTLRPLDEGLILESVRQTGNLIMTDTGWTTGGFGAEVIARVAEKAFGDLKNPPVRIALPDCPAPTSPALANRYYPRAVQIVAAAQQMLGLKVDDKLFQEVRAIPLDIPDKGFTGPF
ncbi:MAG: alpha-ketoacid dehydrogenase subunit beta [Thermodesulfobacteriota bacterium]